MKKLILPLLMMAGFSAVAQPESRVFTISNQAYANLPAPTVITTQGWDDFSAVVPLGFNFTLMGETTDTLYFDDQINYGADMLLGTGNVTNGIGFLTDFVDRSTITGNPASTVSYQKVSGSPNVTKIQWKNAGFFGEQDMNGTLNDSVNFQVWLREGNNDVEVHFGPSRIQSTYVDIFDFSGPVFGFVKNYDMTAGSLDFLYYVSSTATPKVDSMSFAQLAGGNPPTYPTWPANGTVFKFSKPISGGVNGVQLNEYAQVAPTLVVNECVVTLNKNAFDGTVSLIDMSGRIVSSQKAAAGKNAVDMSSLAAGNYILNIRSKEESVFYKITKQ